MSGGRGLRLHLPFLLAMGIAVVVLDVPWTD